MSHRMIGHIAFCIALGLAPAAHAAGTRTHVSNAGSDANTAFSCDSAHPCRTFAAALTVTTPGGEILAIDSSGYGKVTIDRSVSIIAAPGVFAGIGVGSGNGVTIATAGVKVVLRGLTITGQGGSNGVEMSNGASLTVEDCVISGFGAGNGIYVTTAAKVSIANLVARANIAGVEITNGATATISASRFHDNSSIGVYLRSTSSTVTTATVTDSVFSNNYTGIAATSHAPGIAILSVGGSTLVNGVYGLFQGVSAGICVLESLGNNHARQNSGGNTYGTITAAAPL